MFSVILSIVFFSVSFVLVRLSVLALSSISSDIVVRSSAVLSSIIKSPFLSCVNHVMCPLSETLRSCFSPVVLFLITIFRLLGPDGGIHIAGFCHASLSPMFGIGVVVSFVASDIHTISLPLVGETS